MIFTTGNRKIGPRISYGGHCPPYKNAYSPSVKDFRLSQTIVQKIYMPATDDFYNGKS